MGKGFMILFLLLTNVQAARADLASPDSHLGYWTQTLHANPMKLTRKNAARMLGQIGNREALPALVEALKDPFDGVRMESARALGVLGDERAFPALYDISERDTDGGVRSAATEAIEKIRAYQEFLKKKQAKKDASSATSPKP